MSSQRRVNQIASVTQTHSKAEDITIDHVCFGMCIILSCNTHYILPNLYQHAAVDESAGILALGYITDTLRRCNFMSFDRIG
jgi:hypothetical protein